MPEKIPLPFTLRTPIYEGLRINGDNSLHIDIFNWIAITLKNASLDKYYSLSQASTRVTLRSLLDDGRVIVDQETQRYSLSHTGINESDMTRALAQRIYGNSNLLLPDSTIADRLITPFFTVKAIALQCTSANDQFSTASLKECMYELLKLQLTDHYTLNIIRDLTERRWARKIGTKPRGKDERGRLPNISILTEQGKEVAKIYRDTIAAIFNFTYS